MIYKVLPPLNEEIQGIISNEYLCPFIKHGVKNLIYLSILIYRVIPKILPPVTGDIPGAIFKLIFICFHKSRGKEFDKSKVDIYRVIKKNYFHLLR